MRCSGWVAMQWHCAVQGRHCRILERHCRGLARHCCNSQSFATTTMRNEVRVRFAPSPTGHLHLGGLRTAFYNYLFAKAHNGTFILRIEDTDETRRVPHAAEALEEVLAWAGMEPQESPIKGGPKGPYVQSERKHLYQKYAMEMVEKNAAYRCFCSTHRLSLLRKEAVRSGAQPRYDNRCAHLSPAQAAQLAEQHPLHCIRLKLKPTPPVNDLVFGESKSSLEVAEGDPVILKTDGQATYHLANVVDDHLMAITHVMRGVEWLVSTPKHVLMYNALGWTVPEFAHLPLLLNTDGSKLSKRQQSLHVHQLRSDGYTPRALLNFVVEFGGGFAGRKHDQLYNLSELADMFSISGVSSNSAKLDLARLSHMSRIDLLDSLKDTDGRRAARLTLARLVQDMHHVRPDSPVLEERFLSRVLEMSRGRPNDRLHDLVADENLAYLWTPPSSVQPDVIAELNLAGHEPAAVIEAVLSGLQSLPLLVKSDNEADDEHISGKHVNDDNNNINISAAKNGAKDGNNHADELDPNAAAAVVRDVGKTLDIKMPPMMKLIRLGLSGAIRGAPVGEMLATLGRGASLSRLRHHQLLMQQATMKTTATGTTT